jgi:hypothetical protein
VLVGTGVMGLRGGTVYCGLVGIMDFALRFCYFIIILTEIIIIFNCYRVTVTHLTTYSLLYSCNNITLKMAATAVETC